MQAGDATDGAVSEAAENNVDGATAASGKAEDAKSKEMEIDSADKEHEKGAPDASHAPEKPSEVSKAQGRSHRDDVEYRGHLSSVAWFDARASGCQALQYLSQMPRVME